VQRIRIFSFIGSGPFGIFQQSVGTSAPNARWHSLGHRCSSWSQLASRLQVDLEYYTCRPSSSAITDLLAVSEADPVIPNWFYLEFRQIPIRTNRWFGVNTFGLRVSTHSMTSDHYVLLATHRGAVEIRQRDFSADLSSGDILLLPPGAPHRIRARKAGTSIARFPLEFSYPEAAVGNAFTKLPLPVALTFPTKARLEEILGKVSAMGAPPHGNANCLRAYPILNEIMTEYLIAGFSQGVFPINEPRTPAWLEELRLAIEKDHKEAHLKPAHFIEAGGKSATYTERQFKAAFGCTPTNYLNRARVQTAARLLMQNPQIKLETWIVRSGFRTRRLFYRMFRRYVGASPAQFRDNSAGLG